MKKSIILCMFSILALFSCKDPYEGSTYQVYDMNPISTYLDSRPEVFSEWVAILKYADLYNAINQASENFTAFVPDNEAVSKYYAKRNVSSIEELGKEFAIDLAKFHIIHDSINYATFIRGGKLMTRTLSEDFLTVEFGDGGNDDVWVNNEGLVLDFAIQTSNGFVYVLGDVLTPLLESVYERFEENADQYTIFKEILDLTHWKDSLSIIYDEYPLGNGTVRKTKRNYTVLAVPDQSFRNSGINSVNELIESLKDSEYGEPGTNYTDKNNQLFVYTAYHILAGQYEVDDLTSFENASSTKKILTTLSGRILQITEEEDGEVYFNYEAGQDTVAQILVDQSGLMARNGLIHQLDAWLPAWESSAPTEVIWDFLNNSYVAEYINANQTEELQYQKQGPGAEAFIALPANLGCFNAVYAPSPCTHKDNYPPIQYRVSRDETNSNGWTGNLMYNDQMIINLGTNGYIDMTTPALIKGRYKVILVYPYATSLKFVNEATGGSDGGSMRFTFDNDLTNKSVIGRPLMTNPNTLGVYEWVMFDEIEFEETTTHTFRITILDPEASHKGDTNSFRIHLDYLRFEPILD